MSRVNRTKKQRQLFVIREFVGLLGYSVCRARSPDPPAPDALLTLRKGANMNTVAIEHTEYFNDEIEAAKEWKKGKTNSQGMTIFQFWREVKESLKRRISQRRRRYDGKGMIRAKVKLSVNRIWKQNPRQLAGELLDFVEAHLGQRNAKYDRSADFDGYPTMKKVVVSLRFEVTDGWDCFHWQCQNISFGVIGTDVRKITERIKGKNKKAAKYDCGTASEKWLLIAASGSTPGNQAGPADAQVNWVDAGLQEVCGNSPFVRVFFWERAGQWYKSLKPDELAISYSGNY